MATSRVENFVTLYGKAKNDPVLQRVKGINARVDAISKMKADQLDEIAEGINSIGSDILAIVKAEQIANSKYKIVSPLREFIHSITSFKAQEFLECKDPLPKGKVSFKDIAGLEDVKKAMETGYILPFKYPGLFPTVVKGILLTGVPGVGKSLMAKAATKELGDNVAFYAPTPGELKGKYEGETEKNIAAVFECASRMVESKSKYTAAIIFFDEFDSIASARGDDASMTRSVNALLQAMDGIKSNTKVSVLAATNHKSALDTAILSRFTTTIFIDLPDPIAIEYIIRSELAKIYSNPLMSEGEKLATVKYVPPDQRVSFAGGYEGRSNFIENIENPEYNKGIGTRGGNDYVTDAYIKELVEMLGPTSEGKAIKAEIKSFKETKKGKNPSATGRLDMPGIFGYAPRSIVKIVEQASRFAASRSFKNNGDLFTTSILFFHGDASGEYFVPCPDGLGTPGTCTLFVNVHKDAESRSRVVNFDIRKSDFAAAIATMKSAAVNNSQYFEMLKEN